MFLTRLFRHFMEHYPHLDNDIYNVVDRVMRPLALKQTQKPQSDHGMPKACHSISSSSAYHYGSSSHHGDDNEDDDASRAITPSPTTYLNSLSPLNYQRYDIPTSSQQEDDLLFDRQTTLLNQTQKMHFSTKAVEADGVSEIAALTNQMAMFNKKFDKLNATIVAILVGCESFGGHHLTKDCDDKPMSSSEDTCWVNQRQGNFQAGCQTRHG
ncbi:hypothetical protein Tco_0584386 [Tanacetum coccineum]